MDYPQQHIKPYDEEGKKTEQVERMFDNIAHAYDKLNHTLSLGIDRSWRKKAIAWLRPFQILSIRNSQNSVFTITVLPNVCSL